MRQKLQPFWLVFSFWILAVIIANPIGNFPLNDDWAYALSVKNWLDKGQFEIIDWPAMSLYSHVVWGTLWSKLFGFSFTTLRFSILLLAAISMWIFSKLLVELKLSKEQQFIALATIIFNPLYFHLSNTYMTDVSFLACCIFSTYGFWKFFSTEKWYWWLTAILFSVCAILVRQLGLLLPIAFGIALVFQRCTIKSIFLAFAGILITYGSLSGYLFWLDNTTGLPPSFAEIGTVMERLSPSSLWQKTKSRLGIYLIYLGGYLLPLLFLSSKKRFTRTQLVGSLFFLPLLIYLVYNCWHSLPLWNTVYNFGIGALTLPDVIRGHGTFSILSDGQGVVLKLVACIGALLLLWNFVHGIERLLKNRQQQSPSYYFKLGVLFFLISYVFYLLTDKFNFDRYQLPLFIFTILLLPRAEKRKLWPCIVLLIPLMFFSVAGTHDYLDWNRARWQGLTELKAQGITAQEIDGGVEFNGWHQTSHLNPDNKYSKSWWFVDDDSYAVAFEPYKNYEALSAHPFKRYLTLSKDSILILNRSTPQQTIQLSQNHPHPLDSIYGLYKRAQDAIKAIHLAADQKYGLDHQLFPVKPFEKISISFDLLGDRSSFVVVHTAPNAEKFYYAHKPYPLEADNNSWQKMVVEMEIPAGYSSDTLNVYVWKQDETQSISIRDFELQWKRF